MKELVGKYFHSFEDGKPAWQGEVVAVNSDFALVQLFSWLDGGCTNKKFVALGDLFEWTFYDSSETMISAGEGEMSRCEAQIK